MISNSLFIDRFSSNPFLSPKPSRTLPNPYSARTMQQQKSYTKNAREHASCITNNWQWSRIKNARRYCTISPRNAKNLRCWKKLKMSKYIFGNKLVLSVASTYSGHALQRWRNQKIFSLFFFAQASPRSRATLLRVVEDAPCARKFLGRDDAP